MNAGYKDTPPKLSNICDYVEYYAKRTPETDALVLNSVRINYKELHRRVDQLAYALLEFGIRKGDRIAHLSSPQPEFMITFLAAARIGAIWTGLNPKYQLDEFRHVVSDSEPSLIFSSSCVGDRSYLEILSVLRSEISTIKQVVLLDDVDDTEYLSMDEFIVANSLNQQPNLSKYISEVSSVDPVALIYTSGTTGRPKGAVLSHRGLCSAFVIQSRVFQCKPLRLINYLPVNHIGGLGDLSCYALIAGGTIIFQQKFDPSENLRLMSEHRVTLWYGVPTAMQLCTEAPEYENTDLSSIQLVAFGGAAPSLHLVSKLSELGVPFCNTYGQTETSSSVTYVAPTNDVELIASSIGLPVPEYSVRIASEIGVPVEDGGVGEIQVKGECCMLGYWRAASKTREAFTADGWLKTGDLAVKRPDGNWAISGRTKEMFKSGGYNVYPLEIETAISQHPHILEVAVVAVPDDLYGEVGVAFYEMNKPNEEIYDSLVDHCKSRLANYKIPKLLVHLDGLPRLPIGKLDRAALQQMATSKYKPKHKLENETQADCE